jgi:SAM-dependent MidA family methyltransferase
VRWFESFDSLPAEGVSGIIFSNELLDALPVHRLGWDASAQRWFEWAVTTKDGSFVYSKMHRS